MSTASSRCVVMVLLLLAVTSMVIAADPTAELPLNSWVKLTPVAGSPPSPRLGYEGDCRWDPKRQLMIRYGGHNQGGGGEQGSEVFLFDPRTGKWEMREPNIQPPGVCCAQQNIFDPSGDRYIRFPAFSHSHGWQWKREVDLNNWSVWSYDIGGNTWRNMRPVPSPQVSPLRCASWDSDHQVIVLFGGEGNSEGTLIYDPYTNTWTRMKPAKQPEFRSGGSMAYDEARKLHILFGSQFSDDPHTWAYDVKKNEWRDLKPATMPPTKENDAVLAYDPVSRLIIALVKQTEKRKRAEPKKGEDEFEEIHTVATWSFDAGTSEWKKMTANQEPDAAGNRTRQLMWAAGLNAMLLENCPGKPREQQVWAYRVAEGAREKRDQPPMPPAVVRVKVDAKGATIAWDKAPQGASSYVVLAGDAPAEQPWKAELKPVATVGGDALEWRDANAATGAKAGLVRHYAVQARAADNSAGEMSKTVRAQPRVIEDVVVSVLRENRVEVRWPKVGGDVAGYWIERAPVEVISTSQALRIKARTPDLDKPMVAGIRRIGEFKRLTENPVVDPFYLDGTINLSKPLTEPLVDPIYERRIYKEEFDETGKPYPFAVFAYRVRVVNALGVLSGPSPATFTIPSPVQHLFSKEAGTTCKLKWAANPEKGISGYRVYRLDGRYDKQPVSRLSDVIKETTFSDDLAGKSSRRYHVIAVDALGQEGFPSSPVWFEREWKSAYTPFIGEWHQ